MSTTDGYWSMISSTSHTGKPLFLQYEHNKLDVTYWSDYFLAMGPYCNYIRHHISGQVPIVASGELNRTRGIYIQRLMRNMNLIHGYQKGEQRV